MTLLDDAIRFAVSKHSGVLRKSGSTPYILHPLEVAAIVSTLTDDQEVLAAAVLHDTVEDTDTTPEEISELFGPRVAALVASETEDKRPELPPEQSWRIRKEESLAELAYASDPAVKMLWLGDKLSNLRSISRCKKEGGSGIWNSFNQKDPAEQAWYYRSIDALLSGLQDSDAYREFHALVESVFAEVK